MRICIALLAFLALATPRLEAHEVPDRVAITMFVKAEGDHLTILVRMPANALIDYLLPTLYEGNFVDLEHSGALAEEGANVWIANLLDLREEDRALPRPTLETVRLSRLNDPAFRSFDDALARIQSPPLSYDTRARQEQLTVDALLTTPIRSSASRFFFQPRFARLGVIVDTSLTFITPNGAQRVFRYSSDPPAFELDPGRGAALANFVSKGFAHYFDETDYLLFAICIALLFAGWRGLLAFSLLFAAAQTVMLFATLSAVATPFWLRSICGTAIAASIVYAGAEAIIAHDARRRVLAIVTGGIFGYGLWIGLQPELQFGGAHEIVAGAGFMMGVVGAQFLTIASCAAVMSVLRRFSLSPRRFSIVVAALVIHLAWRRLLERADGLALVLSYGRGPDAESLIAGMLVVLALVAVVSLRRRQHAAATSDAGQP
jgi:hypothetical protein